MAKPSLKRILLGIIIGIIFLSSSCSLKDRIISFGDYESDGPYVGEENSVADDTATKDCPIVGLELHGELFTYLVPADNTEDTAETSYDVTASDDIAWAIKDLDADDTVAGIVLEIDSYGGSPVAGEEIANALKTAKKPVVALIRQVGASAAYWSASGADYIVASANSDVGSIGVTSSYLDYSKQNTESGITYIELNTGKFKDSGNPDRPLTAEERALWQRDLDIIHNNFVSAVATNRKLDVAKVNQLADGSSMLGQMALDNGLIDKIGGMDEAMKYFIDNNVITEDKGICWY